MCAYIGIRSLCRRVRKELFSKGREPGGYEAARRLFSCIPVYVFFPDGSDSKASACNVGDLGLILGSGRSSGEGHGNPLLYSCLENSTEEPDGLQFMESQKV